MTSKIQPQITPGRLLLSLASVVTSTGCYLADWNETHIYNPNWPPHAKFHNGQTMSMGLCLGLSGLWYLWRPLAPPATSKALPAEQRGALVKREQKSRLDAATLLASLYWVTQISGILYPGTAGVDPEWDPTGKSFPQLWISGGLLTIAWAGRWLEGRRLGL